MIGGKKKQGEKMNEYETAINAALRFTNIAREMFAMKHSEDFDIDWAMEQFETATDILERMKEYYNA